MEGPAWVPWPQMAPRRQDVWEVPGVFREGVLVRAGGRAQAGARVPARSAPAGAWISGLCAPGSWRHVLMFSFSWEVLICMWHVPRLPPPPSAGSNSEAALHVQDLLGASGRIKKAAHYTVSSKTSLNRRGCGARQAGWVSRRLLTPSGRRLPLVGGPHSLLGVPGHRARGMPRPDAGQGHTGHPRSSLCGLENSSQVSAVQVHALNSWLSGLTWGATPALSAPWGCPN